MFKHLPMFFIQFNPEIAIVVSNSYKPIKLRR